MIRTLVFYIILITQFSSSAQQFELVGEIGEFENASSFFINQTGFIFISDIQRNEISKYDTAGNKIISIGGYGWNESSFDEPVDIYATTLDVYVTDMNNHRIQIFDKLANYSDPQFNI